MPIEYRIDPSMCELFVRIFGVVSDRELLDEAERMLKDPLFPHAPRVVWDAREREDVPSPNVIAPMLGLLSQYEPTLRGARCALVTSQTASFGIQRMFTFRSESFPFEIRAFHDLEQARSWLEDPGANGSA